MVVVVAILSGIGSVLMTHFVAFAVLRFLNATIMPQIYQLPYIIREYGITSLALTVYELSKLKKASKLNTGAICYPFFLKCHMLENPNSEWSAKLLEVFAQT